MTFVSVITERELLGNSIFNLVAYAVDTSLFDVHDQLVAAADIIQARYRYTPFLLEASAGVDARQVEALDGTFEVSLRSGLYCVPFLKRPRLPDADYTMSDFQTYCKLFDALRGEGDVDLDDVWQDCYEQLSLIHI